MQGRAEGEAYALRRLLQKRFGPLSEDVLARLQSASIDELELWLDRALDADSLAGCLLSKHCYQALLALWYGVVARLVFSARIFALRIVSSMLPWVLACQLACC